MRILVIGSGGREHVLVWKLTQSPEVKQVFCAPGNAGIGTIATCLPIGATDIVELADFAEKMRIDLTIVGPELTLTLGVVDEFTKRGLTVFGPNKLAAELEGSKVFSKSFMKKYGIPTADAEVCRERREAEEAIKKIGLPCVFKADGLAAGKGVTVVNDADEAARALRLYFDERVFGSAGDRVLIESFIAGEEISMMVLCDGERGIPLATAKDYKRVWEGDRGPNTGGMGSHSPSVFLDGFTAKEVLTEIVQPTLKGMKQEGRPFRGLLFVGLIVDKAMEAKVLEYNVRFGDPETQSIMIRWQDDIVPYLLQSARGSFETTSKPAWRKEAAACVVLTADGYPGPFERGRVITGIEEVQAVEGMFVFHSGTSRNAEGQWVTSGGRVLNVCCRARTMSEAVHRAVQGAERIHFEGKHFRRDIGARALEILLERTSSGLS